MSTAHKVAKNTVIMMVGNLAFRLLSLAVVIYLARYLSVEDFGRYNFVFAYLGFFNIITDFGLGDITVREMSRNSNSMQNITGNVHIIKIFLSIIAAFLSVSMISLIGYPPTTTLYVYAASIILFFQSFSDTFKAIFVTSLKMQYEILSKIISKIVFVGLVLYIIAFKGTLYHIILAFIFFEFLRALLNYTFSRKIVRAKFEIDFSMWKNLFKESIPIALSGVFLVIYHRIDILMLSMMIKGLEADIAVGLYSAAYKLSEPLGLISTSLVVSLYPLMSKSFKGSKSDLFKTYEIGLKYTVILMLPIAVGTTLIADKIILLIYDSSYEGSITALQILIWSLFLASINLLLISSLTSINKQRLNTLSMGVCVVANIVLNMILIPSFSYNGASIATVITELILLLMSLYFVSVNLDVPPVKAVSFKPLVSCLIMGIPVYYMNNFTTINVFFTVLFGVAFYLMALLGTNTFSKDEKEIIKYVLSFNVIYKKMRFLKE